MRRPRTTRQCKHCQTFVVPDSRCVRRQRDCSTPACRQASQAASQRRWHHKPANHDYCTGPTQVERVRQWRRAHPGYGRRQASRPPPASQEDCTPQAMHNQGIEGTFTSSALPEDFFRHPAVFLGLIAH